MEGSPPRRVRDTAWCGQEATVFYEVVVPSFTVTSLDWSVIYAGEKKVRKGKILCPAFSKQCFKNLLGLR